MSITLNDFWQGVFTALGSVCCLAVLWLIAYALYVLWAMRG